MSKFSIGFLIFLAILIFGFLLKTKSKPKNADESSDQSKVSKVSDSKKTKRKKKRLFVLNPNLPKRRSVPAEGTKRHKRFKKIYRFAMRSQGFRLIESPYKSGTLIKDKSNPKTPYRVEWRHSEGRCNIIAYLSKSYKVVRTESPCS